MIENEMAKLEKPDQVRSELLFVPELGEECFVLVVDQLVVSHGTFPGE